MDESTAVILNELNRTFYEQNAASFSETRSHAWPGWNVLSERVGNPSSILDLACGNMRFQRFWNDTHRGREPEWHCFDACETLADALPGVPCKIVDLVKILMDETDPADAIEAPPCDLTVSFGFMHHVPGANNRRKLLELMAEKTLGEGCFCVSLWRFAEEEKLARKATQSTEKALDVLDIVLDEGDYILGWQGREGALRYCHSFSEAEIGQLLASLESAVSHVERYDADGRNGALNTYLLMKKR